MVNKEFSKDIAKALKKESISSELKPGETKRRYEPVGGVKNLNDRIHRESLQLDKYGNLPFSFSKPVKNTNKRYTVKVCENCGEQVMVHENCIGIACSTCHKYSSVVDIVEEDNLGEKR